MRRAREKSEAPGGSYGSLPAASQEVVDALPQLQSNIARELRERRIYGIEVEDLVAESVLSGLRDHARGQAASSVDLLARSRCIVKRFLRARRREPRAIGFNDVVALESHPRIVRGWFGLPANAPGDPLNDLLRSEQLHRIAPLLQRLPARQYTAFMNHHVVGESFAAIARRCHLNESTVREAAENARRNLRCWIGASAGFRIFDPRIRVRGGSIGVKGEGVRNFDLSVLLPAIETCLWPTHSRG